jgi:hypothetical protein
MPEEAKYSNALTPGEAKSLFPSKAKKGKNKGAKF